MKKNSIIILAICLLAAIVSGCGGSPQKPAAPQKAPEKILRVGTEPTFPPFEYNDEKNEYVGFDMDLIRALGKELGYTVKIQSLGFDALIPALDAGNIDVAASGITITEERAKRISFTKAYYETGLTIIVPKDNTTIKDFPDLEGKRLGAQIGTTGAMEAQRVKGASTREFNTPNEAFLEMKNGGIDAVVNDRPVNEYFLKNGGGAEYAKMVGKPRNAENYGFATSKKNAALAAELTKALDTLRKNGEYHKIYEKWFGK